MCNIREDMCMYSSGSVYNLSGVRTTCDVLVRETFVGNSQRFQCFHCMIVVYAVCPSVLLCVYSFIQCSTSAALFAQTSLKAFMIVT